MTDVIFGWDASDYDHERGMNAAHIKAAASEGVSFFVHKATEHSPKGLHRHQNYGTKLQAARDAGIPFLGAYVVARTGVPEAEQAASAVEHVSSQAAFALAPPDGFRGFFWQVDLEHWPHDEVAPEIGERLADELERLTGRKAVIYAPRWAYGDTVHGNRPIWNSDYRGSGDPADFREQWKRVQASPANQGFAQMSGRTPRILQYASDATIGGQSTCDANVFRGSLDDFAAMIGI